MKRLTPPGIKHTALAVALALSTTALSAQTLRIAASDPVSSIDPQLNNYAGDHNMGQQMWPQLLSNIGNRIGPDLATEWKNIDPHTWEFHLAEDARWSDGEPVTAEDVKFSYERAKDVPGSVATFAGFLRSVDSVEAKDAHTLVVKTKSANPILPIDLSSVYIVSEHVGKDASTEDYNSGEAMVTAGPYKFDSYAPGDRVTMTRNDDFWGKKPAWEKVDFRIVPSAASRTAALLAGDVDMIDKVSPSDLEKLEKNPDINVWTYNGLRVLLLQPSFNPDPIPYITDHAGKPLDENPLLKREVRQALNTAINRKAIVQRITLDSTTEANQWMPKDTIGYNPEVKDIAYDPDHAKELLAEAGYPDGFKLTLHVPTDRYPLAPEAAQAVAQFWTRIGVDTKVDVVPFSVYAGKAKKNEYAVSMIAWGNGTGEASYAMTNILGTVDPDSGVGASNWGHYSNKDLDQALADANNEFDDDKREAILRDGVKVVSDDVGIMPLFHYKNIWATKKGIKVTPWWSDRTVAMQAEPED